MSRKDSLFVDVSDLTYFVLAFHCLILFLLLKC